MNLSLGAENKKQVYLLISLFCVIVIMTALEVRSSFSGRPATVRGEARMSSPSKVGKTAGAEQQRPTALRIGEIARSEQVQYTSAVRNIFSAESAPVHIEAPVAPPRPAEPAVVMPPPAPPKPLVIELKYLGYTETGDRSVNALFIHGNEVLAAGVGEIVFHRYQVKSVLPTSALILDLSSNRTQSIPLGEK